MIAEAIEGILKLGLPVALISWFVVRRLYARGELHRGGGQKELEKQIEGIKAVEVDFRKPDELLRNKWLQLGGGFYGAAGLWTLFVLELADLAQLFSAFPGWTTSTNRLR